MMGWFSYCQLCQIESNPKIWSKLVKQFKSYVNIKTYMHSYSQIYIRIESQKSGENLQCIVFSLNQKDSGY